MTKTRTALLLALLGSGLAAGAVRAGEEENWRTSGMTAVELRVFGDTPACEQTPVVPVNSLVHVKPRPVTVPHHRGLVSENTRQAKSSAG